MCLGNSFPWLWGLRRQTDKQDRQAGRWRREKQLFCRQKPAQSRGSQAVRSRVKAAKSGTLPQGRVGEGPPSQGRSSGGCWWGPAGRATAAPVPRQRERQPSCVLSVSTYVPLRSFPRKSSMSEAGAGMSAQSPTRSWPPPGLGLSTPKIAL